MDEEEAEVATDDPKDTSSMAEVLIGRDDRSRVCCAIPVPQKKIDMQERSLRESLRFQVFLGYTNLMLANDWEIPLGAH